MRTAVRFAFVVALVLPAGCNYLTPKTYQLEQIHATYTTEWAQSQLPATSASGRSDPGNMNVDLADGGTRPTIDVTVRPFVSNFRAVRRQGPDQTLSLGRAGARRQQAAEKPKTDCHFATDHGDAFLKDGMMTESRNRVVPVRQGSLGPSRTRCHFFQSLTRVSL